MMSERGKPKHRTAGTTNRQASTGTCKGPGLIGGHGPEVAQVALVADQHDNNVVVGVVSQLLQPALHILIYLSLYRLAVHLNAARGKLHPNGALTLEVELISGKPREQVALPDARIPN
ncbi:hypothetical protein EYF80_012679 [Liparis tanakae]|uniref:Uncharacterized protein n=1 Tax=Liparis tanakae TaxID=230148 RepID=A0A4Z2IH44_9TELE|nr:hypothetical protein EYF80_012679 [Liparis tanakae]